MKLCTATHTMLFLAIWATAMTGQATDDAKPATVGYIVLSKTQVLIKVDCTKGCSATLVDSQKPGRAEAITWKGLANPRWTLVTFKASDFQFESKKLYIVEIGHAAAGVKPDLVQVDTTPNVGFAPKAQRANLVNLNSNVAIALPGKSTPLVNSVEDCPNKAPHQFVNFVLQYPGVEATFNKTGLCEIEMDKLPSLDDPDAVSVLQGGLLKQSSKSDGLSKPPVPQISGLVSVLGDQLQAPNGPNLGAAKAPATEADAWLWISGTVTAGTGTAPAWVLDGKLAPPPLTRQMGAWVATWLSASADVGNNKINGQAAKDVIDFNGPLFTDYQDWKTVGATLSFAPTYETNLALNHRNMLVVGDAVWDFGRLNENQTVRTAIAHRDDPTKMPKQGDFGDQDPKKRYAAVGWNLHFHTGFEAGGALAPVTVTNPKTKATIGTLPTYSIARAVPQVDGLLQLKGVSIESLTTGRYLFTTEHTAVNDKAGIPYLETVSGWKAVHVLTFNWTPGSNQNLSFNVGYTDGFSAPTYQRANGVKIGLLVKY